MTIFQKRVFDIVKKIPRGQVLSYAEVSWRLGSKDSARAAGNALNKNHDKQVPCHRVVRSDGRVGGFNGGEARKIALLKAEGVRVENGKMINIITNLPQPSLKGGSKKFHSFRRG